MVLPCHLRTEESLLSYDAPALVDSGLFAPKHHVCHTGERWKSDQYTCEDENLASINTFEECYAAYNYMKETHSGLRPLAWAGNLLTHHGKYGLGCFMTPDRRDLEWWFDSTNYPWKNGRPSTVGQGDHPYDAIPNDRPADKDGAMYEIKFILRHGETFLSFLSSSVFFVKASLVSS